ncbi:hypothetical protein HPB50_021546 [Hyalomma asiaticum]|uniref:Uncharacterized protein n=1 Tax=Hyalomma asiaticum TaxID=266040 RepID=A0ACB7TNB6_HYAAI|nr:hypothetical protein HPB50_021546 [Hyalomma asiaticum]
MYTSRTLNLGSASGKRETNTKQGSARSSSSSTGGSCCGAVDMRPFRLLRQLACRCQRPVKKRARCVNTRPDFDPESGTHVNFLGGRSFVREEGVREQKQPRLYLRVTKSVQHGGSRLIRKVSRASRT